MNTATGIHMSSLGFAMALLMLLMAHSATSQRSLFPLFNSTEICRGVDCGNGTCVSLKDPPYAKCECYQGWKQPDVPIPIPYLACVIPNCTIDYNCEEGSAPAPLPSFHGDHDNVPDPCEFGGVCGGGRCVRNNSELTYQCKCYPGYGNIMSWPPGFCFRQSLPQARYRGTAPAVVFQLVKIRLHPHLDLLEPSTLLEVVLMIVSPWPSWQWWEHSSFCEEDAVIGDRRRGWVFPLNQGFIGL